MTEPAELKSFMGRTCVRVTGAARGSRAVGFHFTDGLSLMMYHKADCCERVTVEEISGDVAWLIGSPITVATEVTTVGFPAADGLPYHGTWTFYSLSTVRGTVVFRWYGDGNGYYSEAVEVVYASESEIQEYEKETDS